MSGLLRLLSSLTIVFFSCLSIRSHALLVPCPAYGVKCIADLAIVSAILSIAGRMQRFKSLTFLLIDAFDDDSSVMVATNEFNSLIASRSLYDALCNSWTCCTALVPLVETVAVGVDAYADGGVDVVDITKTWEIEECASYEFNCCSFS